MEKELDKSDKEIKNEEFVEITVYTFFQPPDGGSTVRADMPIDVLRIKKGQV